MNRQDFPWLIHHKNSIFFDNAASSHKPSQVIEAIANFYKYDYAPVYRSIYSVAENATLKYEQVRNKVAQFINAKYSSEIVFVRGATEGINFIAATWALEYINEGDEIVLTQLEHHADLLPWQWVAQQKKAVLRFIPASKDGTLDLSDLSSIITSRTKLVAATSVSNIFGLPTNIEPIIAHARSVGAKVLIDACQEAPHYQIDVQKLDADFLVFSAHKMLGPTGIGVLYIKKELHDSVPPYQRGGGMVKTVSFFDAIFSDAPEKFQAGTLPIAEVIGFGAALGYYNEHVDFVELQRHEQELTQALIDGLLSFGAIETLGPVNELKQHGHGVIFRHKDYHPHDVAAFFDSHGVYVRAGHFCAQPFFNVWNMSSGALRVSFLGYNTLQEVGRFLLLLKKI